MISSKQHNGGGGCGRDQIKKLEKENDAGPDGLQKAPMQSSPLGPSQTHQRKQSPSKVTNELPNYKKSTSRFDASKDNLQVSTDSSTSSKIKSMNIITQNTISSNPVSSSVRPGSKAVAKDRGRIPDLKPLRSSMKKNSGVGLYPTVNLNMATYSSAIKIARNPESLDLDEPDGVSNQKLCSYKYCSLHGQKKNEASLPALKCFLSARRQSVKVPNSMKQKEQSSTRKHCRNEIYSKAQEGTLQLQRCEERSQDEVKIVDIAHGINLMIMGGHDETNQLQESYSVTSFEDYVDNNSEISIEENEVFEERFQYIDEERQEETHLNVDWEEAAGSYLHSQSNSLQFFDDFKVDYEIQQSTTFSYSYANGEESEKSANGSLQSGVELFNSPKELLEADLENLEVHCEEGHDKEANVENVRCCEPSKHGTIYESQQGIRSNYDKGGDISDGLANGKENVINSASFISKNPIEELTNEPKAKYSTTRKLTTENQETAREFNPRPPRFLPLKPELKAEVVSLKHRDVEERMTAEEWMVDYALRKTLGRMAPARKRKVALLVAAFESVIQQEKRATAPCCKLNSFNCSAG